MKFLFLSAVVLLFIAFESVISQQTQTPDDKKEHIAHRAGDKK
jgi:hypothetical protein